MFGFGNKRNRFTERSFQRWLNAGQPQPIEWFLSHDEDQQERMAEIGTEYTFDKCVAIGRCVEDPELAERGAEAMDNPIAERSLVQEIAAGVAKKMVERGPEPQVSRAPPTMAGITKRNDERMASEVAAMNGPKTLFGRPCDAAKAEQAEGD